MSQRFIAHIFGRFHLTDRQEDREVDLRSRKAAALVAYLAVAGGRPITRERIMGLLWGSRSEEQARASLRQALHEVRSSPLGSAGAIEIDRRELAAVAAVLRTDADEIAAIAASGDIARLAALVGDLDEIVLDGLDGIDNGLDEWLRVERERQLLWLTGNVFAACQADQRPETLVDRRTTVSALQRLNPGDEATARLGFELDHAAGDLAALHRRHRWLEDALRRAYDAEPSPETQRLFRQLTTVAPVHTAPEPAPSTAARQAPGAEPPILVLLPIELAGGGEGEQQLANLCLTELEIAFGGIADLRLLSLADPSPFVLEAACGASIASYSLRGTLHVVGEEMRLGWRLLRLRDGRLVWSRRFAEPRQAFGAMMDDIVAAVAGAVLPAVERDLEHAVPHGPLRSSATGYELYLQGRALHLSGTILSDMHAAAALYEEAIARDSRLVNAHLNLAQLYNTDYKQLTAGHDTTPLRARAFDLCARAVASDPLSAQAHARLGWCYMRRGDIRQSRQRFEEALALNPHHADCVNEIGFALCHLGDLDAATRLLARAFELNPFPRNEYFCDMGILRMMQGRHDAAEEQFEVVRESDYHYRGFRLANRALRGSEQALDEAAEELRREFGSMWQRPSPPTDADLLAALVQFVPLQQPEHRALLRSGLAAAGFAVGG